MGSDSDHPPRPVGARGGLADAHSGFDVAELFPAEQCRLAQLLLERVVIAGGGLEIIWRDQAWQELAGELMPGTIGAELQEWEQQEVEA